MDENKKLDEEAVKENTDPEATALPVEEEASEKTTVKEDVQKKNREQLDKKREKEEGKSRILDYLKEEHKWENWLFLVISAVTLLLGTLILSGTLAVKESFPLLGDYPKVFAWIIVVVSGAGLIYALYPFYKPAFPELKKITWLSGKEFLENTIRTFVFIIVFTLLFLLYDSFIQQILSLIFNA